MNSLASKSLVCLLFSCSTAYCQVSDSNRVQGNIRGVHTFDCQISPRLPVYTFAVVGDTDNYISEIRISVKGSTGVQQVLTGFGTEPPYKGSKYLQFEDLNFDGYKDIKLLAWWGSGGQGYNIWLFHPLKETFVYNEQLSNLGNVSAVPESKTISSSYRSGWASHGSALYQFAGDSLLLIRSETTEWIESEKHFLKTVRVRRDGVMIDSLQAVVHEGDE
jgi:hypothetical protein